MRKKDEKTLMFNTLPWVSIELAELVPYGRWVLAFTNRKTWDQTSHVMSTYLFAHLFISVSLCPFISLFTIRRRLSACLSVSACGCQVRNHKWSVEALMCSLFFLFPFPYHCRSFSQVESGVLSCQHLWNAGKLAWHFKYVQLHPWQKVLLKECVCVMCECIIIMSLLHSHPNITYPFTYNAEVQWSASIKEIMFFSLKTTHFLHQIRLTDLVPLDRKDGFLKCMSG